MIARLFLTLALLTSQASALSCYSPTHDQRAEELRTLKLNTSETETLVSGTFRFERILDRELERGNETIIALWTFEGERYFGGKTMKMSMPVEVKFRCWQHRCDRARVRATQRVGTVRLLRESADMPWTLYLGDCTGDVFEWENE